MYVATAPQSSFWLVGLFIVLLRVAAREQVPERVYLVRDGENHRSQEAHDEAEYLQGQWRSMAHYAGNDRDENRL